MKTSDWARDLTDDELISERERICAIIDRGFGEHGGSPGEYYYERLEELDTEIRKRGLIAQIQVDLKE